MVYKIDDGFEELNSGCADEEPQDAGPGVMGHMLIKFQHMKEKVERVALSPRRGSSNPNTPRAVETTQQEKKPEDLQSESPYNVESKVGENHPQEYSLPNQQHNGFEAVDVGSTGDGGQIEDGFSVTEGSSSLETATSPRGGARSNAEGAPAGAGGNVEDGFYPTGGSSSLDAGISQRGNPRSDAEGTPGGAGGYIGDGFGPTLSSQEAFYSPRGSARSDTGGTPAGAGGFIGDGLGPHGGSFSRETFYSPRGSPRSDAEGTPAGAGEYIGDGFGPTGGSFSLEPGISPRGSARSNAEGTPAGAGRHIGDRFGATGGASSLEAGASPRGSARSNAEGKPGSPSLLHMDLGEKIIGKLPGSHANPYSTGGSIPATSPTSPSVQKSAPSSPSLFGRLEIMTKFADKLTLGRRIWSPRAAASSESPDMATTNTSAQTAEAGMSTSPPSRPAPVIGTATGPKEY